MVRPFPYLVHVRDHITSFPIPLAIGLFVTVSVVLSLCAKHAKRYSDHQNTPHNYVQVPSPKKLITTTSNKANNKSSSSSSHRSGNNDDQKEYQENGTRLWQKAILMGERCQPPDSAGVIYYDYSGNRVAEMPKSPRASSLSPLKSFNNFQKIENSVYY